MPKGLVAPLSWRSPSWLLVPKTILGGRLFWRDPRESWFSLGRGMAIAARPALLSRHGYEARRGLRPQAALWLRLAGFLSHTRPIDVGQLLRIGDAHCKVAQETIV